MTKHAADRYIGITMKWHTMFMLTVLLLMMPSVGAESVNQVPIGIGIEGGWYASIPSRFHEDPLAVRSHGYAGATITPMALRLSPAVTLSAGWMGSYTSRSLSYGTTVWRPFFATGPVIHTNWSITENAGVTFEIGVLPSWYVWTWDYATIVRISAIGEFTIGTNQGKDRLSVTLPFHFDIRGSYGAFSVGVGLTWRHLVTPVQRNAL